MHNVNRVAVMFLLFVAVMLIGSMPAFAQIDFTGVWQPNTTNEDNPERLQGPSLVEFVGLPINDNARVWGLSYRPSRLSLPEHQCQVHVVEYIHRGPMAMRMFEERDPISSQLIAIHEHINTYEQFRTIWMDGRPHPSEYAPHTWMGFSTGVWEGAMLTVTTTHVKQGWHRRENIPSSDEVTVIEHYVRHGNTLSHISITEDPIFLAEPLIKSEDFTLNAGNNFSPYWECELADEGEYTRGAVPSYFAGENPYEKQYAAEHNLPANATLGGPQTMYPEYRAAMKTMPVAVYTSGGAVVIPAPQAPPPPPAAAGAGGAGAAGPGGGGGRGGGGGGGAPAAPAGGGRGGGAAPAPAPAPAPAGRGGQ